MKRMTFLSKQCLSIVALLHVLALMMVSCTSDGEDEKLQVSDRTVIMYLSAQNTLTGWMKADSTEIWNGAKRMANGQKLVVFMDTQKSPAIYVLTNRTTHTAQAAYRFSGAVDSSDPQTLAAVITWAKQNATAKEYGLVMASHADGWLPSRNTDYVGVTSDSIAPTGARRLLSWGIDSEQTFRDYKSNGRIGTQMNAKALAEAIESTGIKLKYLFFDACLMQNLEVAYDLRHAAEYLIASPMYIPAAGAYYTNMVPKGLFSADPIAIAKQYMEDAQDATNERADNYASVGMIISVLRLEYMDRLAEATQTALAESLLYGAEPQLTGVQAYLAFQGYPAFHDAGMSMERLTTPERYAEWRQVFDDVVAYKAATERFIANNSSNLYYTVQADYTGVSMFVPQQGYATISSPWGNHNVNFQQTTWYHAAGWSQTGW